MGAKILVKPGTPYNYLTVIAEDKPKGNRRAFKCECVCGKIVTVVLSQITTGHTRSCGCYMRQRAREANTKHGFASRDKKCPEYKVWKGIRQRCNNPNNPKYYRYGARGIRCLWDSFEKFIVDMGFRPSSKHSIGRRNNNGNYCKKNCEWQIAVQQMNNTSRNRKFFINGHWFTISQLARKNNIKSATLRRRLLFDWPITKAISTPVKYIHNEKIRHNGIELSLKGWSRYLNKSYQALYVRKRHNWSIKAMLETPVKVYKKSNN